MWREGRWVVDLGHVHETGLNRARSAMRREGPGGQAEDRLRSALAQAYRIILTRGIYGTRLWFEDPETRRYVESCMEKV